MSTFNTAFTFRRRITLKKDHIDANLTNFPLKVSFSGDASIGAACRADGYDVIFTSEDGTTALKFEREYFNISGGLATGVFWVKVPAVSKNGTTAIYMYYGDADATNTADPTNVWDSNFKAVYHMKDGADASHTNDSTAGAHTGTKKFANQPIQSDGLIYKAQTFNGTEDYIDADDHADFDITAEITIETLIYLNEITAGQVLVTKGISASWTSNNYIMGLLSGKLEGRWGTVGTVSADAALTVSGWHHVAFTVAPGTTDKLALYVDGVLVKNANRTGDPTTNNAVLRMGVDATQSNPFDGIMDEMRISNAARSAAWMKFSAHNMIDVDGCLSWGPERRAFSFGQQGAAGETHKGVARARLRRR